MFYKPFLPKSFGTGFSHSSRRLHFQTMLGSTGDFSGTEEFSTDGNKPILPWTREVLMETNYQNHIVAANTFVSVLSDV